MTKLISFLTGNLFSKLLVETVLAIVARIAWAEVVERFLMRVIKIVLRKLVARTTNTVDDQLAEDIIASLENRSLPKV